MSHLTDRHRPDVYHGHYERLVPGVPRAFVRSDRVWIATAFIDRVDHEARLRIQLENTESRTSSADHALGDHFVIPHGLTVTHIETFLRRQRIGSGRRRRASLTPLSTQPR